MENSKQEKAQEKAVGEAARYCARLAASDCSEDDREACRRWRAADFENELAFRRMSALSMRIDRAIHLATDVDSRLQQAAARAYAAGTGIPSLPAKNSAPVAHFHRRPIVRMASAFARIQYRAPAALAAGVLVAAMSAWFATDRLYRPDSVLSGAQLLIAPQKSAREVTLADRSVVHIDAGAKLSVTFSASSRRVEVLSGRAFFEVAHDAERPFIVTAGDTETVALGTQFEVLREETQTAVTLLEGSVAVSGNGARWRERLTPGDQLRTGGGDSKHVLQRVDAESVTSWSRGWLVFHGAPLDEALGEVNRYSAKQVVLADASLANLKVAGSFVAGDSESIVGAFAEVLPIRVVNGGSREILLFKRYEN